MIRVPAVAMAGLLACAAAPAPIVPTGPFLPPVTPACISSPFGPRILPHRPLAGTFHPGIDLPAPEGAPVRAAGPGQVIRVQHHGPGGLEVLVQHAGYVGVYSHLGRVAPAIAEGRRTLRGGQQIGVVGHTGVMYGMHLYFGMIVDGRPVDPTRFFTIEPCGSTKAARRPPTRQFAGGASPPG